MSATRGHGWSAEEIRRAGYRVIDLIAAHLAGLRGRPVFHPYPRELRELSQSEASPEKGVSADEVIDVVAKRILPWPLGNGHPRFFGWVNSPPSIMGVFAEALAAAMNPSVAGGNHAAVHLEHQVLRWMKEWMGFPTQSGGLLVSGGSMATLTALAVARHAKAGFDVRARGLAGGPRLTAYVGGEGHGCIRKAVELLGIGGEQLRVIPSDDRLRMRVDKLAEAIRSDKEAGLRPFAVAASAGTVNSGAIDPLSEMISLCKHEGVWLHVDGAYGAPARLSARARPLLEALSEVDSLAIDPHKWLCVPVECGLVLIRDANAMRDAFSLVPPYLRTDGNPDGVGGPPWFSEFGFQQTRAFRALKLWMTLVQRGRDGISGDIERDLESADLLERRVREAGDLELAAPRGLSIVCFRYRAKGLDPTAEDVLNQKLLEDIQLGGEVFLSGTTVLGRFALRACFVNPLTTPEDVELLVDRVRQAGHRLQGGAQTPP